MNSGRRISVAAGIGVWLGVLALAAATAMAGTHGRRSAQNPSGRTVRKSTRSAAARPKVRRSSSGRSARPLRHTARATRGSARSGSRATVRGAGRGSPRSTGSAVSRQSGRSSGRGAALPPGVGPVVRPVATRGLDPGGRPAEAWVGRQVDGVCRRRIHRVVPRGHRRGVLGAGRALPVAGRPQRVGAHHDRRDQY